VVAFRTGDIAGKILRARKKIKRNLEIALTRGLMGFARVLPRETGFRVFSAIGDVAGLILRKDRDRALDNLEIAFPHMSLPVRRAMTRAMFKALGRNAFEFLNLAGSSRERLTGLVERVEGQEYLDGALAVGRGIIAVSGHIGCWELMGGYFASRGYEFSVVGRQLWEPRLNRELLRIRESVGLRTIDRDGGGKEILRILRSGGIVAILADQHTRVSGVYVPFFSRPAHTPIAIAKLAMKTGAKIVPLAIYMTLPGRHVIRILPAVAEPPVDESVERRAEIITEHYSRALEDLIRYDPKQWVWFHKRWRDQVEADVSYAVAN